MERSCDFKVARHYQEDAAAVVRQGEGTGIQHPPRYVPETLAGKGFEHPSKDVARLHEQQIRHVFSDHRVHARVTRNAQEFEEQARALAFQALAQARNTQVLTRPAAHDHVGARRLEIPDIGMQPGLGKATV